MNFPVLRFVSLAGLRSLKCALVITAGLASFTIGMAPAQAATVAFDNGEVLVNTGSGFKRVQSGGQLKAGDLVMTKTGIARVVYTATCYNEVQVDRVYRVQTEGECVATGEHPIGGLSHDILTGVLIAGGITAGVIVAISNDSHHQVSP